jgi:hypothetical protein
MRPRVWRAKALLFKNPANGYVDEVNDAPLWCLLFGCFYFAVKGVWTHAIAAFFLAIVTVGISWLIYPFFATPIIRKHYLQCGWFEIEAPEYPSGPSWRVAAILVFSLIAVLGAVVGEQYVTKYKTFQTTNFERQHAPVTALPPQKNQTVTSSALKVTTSSSAPNTQNTQQAHLSAEKYATRMLGAGPDDTQRPRRNPPISFRGIKWDSALPSLYSLRKTVLKGCPLLVRQKNFTDTPPCSHMHTSTDNMDMFAQRQNVPPIFGVQVSEQVFTWSHRKFWTGNIYIYDYKPSDLERLRAALIENYGQPTFNKKRLTKWAWPDKKLEISLSFDPVAKPSLGSNKPPQTSISLSFGRIE